jgi:hypothetical protein
MGNGGNGRGSRRQETLYLGMFAINDAGSPQKQSNGAYAFELIIMVTIDKR